ncbi:hypothetical protein IEQ34_018141 [Dendrobium chrysotoxum]|uniref:Uncharacterized protein n=1 Tax=Dendrobium chrysotoxum TaxID=161865 RepID=A0AAV7GDE2_DENCH|nr:hypothetical protein IEQ34_018141 [Dendrobium chrysotoxum]
MAFCNSSIVLSSEEENVLDGATRSPLFAGDVRIDAGAEKSPRHRRRQPPSRGLESREKE